MVTECAFGQLKGAWRLLYRKSEVNQLSLKVNVLACFVLHDICIEKLVSINLKLLSLLLLLLLFFKRKKFH